jgi:hypothetical protein
LSSGCGEIVEQCDAIEFADFIVHDRHQFWSILNVRPSAAQANTKAKRSVRGIASAAEPDESAKQTKPMIAMDAETPTTMPAMRGLSGDSSSQSGFGLFGVL